MHRLELTRVAGTVAAALLAAAVAIGCSRGGAPDTTARSAADSTATASGGAAMPSASPEVHRDGALPNTETGKFYDDSITKIDALVGERFAIRLPANITTPYKWIVAPANQPDRVVLVERHYQGDPPPDCPACVGYPGTDTLTFEARATGEAMLTLRYSSIVASSDPPEREIVVYLTVKQR